MGEFPELPKRVPLRGPRPEPELKTAEEMFKAIRRIMKRRLTKANESQYDVMVCIRSVDAAQVVFERIPVEGRPIGYGNAVQAALDDLRESYWDSEGEYTSKGMVGDVCSDVYDLLHRQYSFKHRNIDKEEASLVIKREMQKVLTSIQTPSAALSEANIKIEAPGKSGTIYYVEIVFEDASNECASMTGSIYSDEFYENLIEVSFERLISDDG
jgi:hypothetical protein